MPDIPSLKSFYIHISRLVETKLWAKVVTGMLMGIILGLLLGRLFSIISPQTAQWITNWLALPGMLFLRLVQMVMIPLIVASIMKGLVSATDTGQLKRMGIGIGIYFLATTAISIGVGILVASVLKPGNYFRMEVPVVEQEAGEIPAKASFHFVDIPNHISELVPGNLMESMLTGEMLSIILFAIIVGIAITSLSKELAEPLVKLTGSVLEVCMIIVKWAMKLAPYAVFGLMAQLVSGLGLHSLLGIGYYVFSVLLGLFLLMMFYLLIVWLAGRINPLEFLRGIKDVQLLAFSTTSSAAVMPLSIKTAEEKFHVRPSISSFLIPVGATVNMDGTAVYQCISTLFIAQVYQLEMGAADLLLLMFTIVVASIGTPAIPGGGIVVFASILTSVGIPAEGIVMIIGVERILGMFRTAVNVTGDLTACVFFNQMQKKAAGEVRNEDLPASPHSAP